MKTLRQILPANVVSTTGALDIEISDIAFDSRKVTKGCLFVALPGHHVDGCSFIYDALERGAVAIMLEGIRKNIEVPVVKVANARQALSEISANFYDYPSQKITLNGITGTKGKTTITYLLQSILKHAFKHAFRIGTVEYDMEYEKFPATNTTPESQIIHYMIDHALKNGIRHGVMEVSSHALRSWRVEDLAFSVVGFTNLSIEHTEFHPDMQDYFNAKKRLFLELKKDDKTCIISIDDQYGKKLAEECKKQNLKVQTVSVHNTEADFYSEKLQMTGTSSSFFICHNGEKHNLKTNLTGEFNVANTIMAAAMAFASNATWDQITTGLAAIKSIPGRLEAVSNCKGINVIVDYAHSPAALENVLKAVRPVTRNRLITVFGCGGNRSREKRPIMGQVALENSDIVFITSDNPRKEPPDDIIKEILDGIEELNQTLQKPVHHDSDRKAAIFKALELAQEGDTVLIAGKGHETGQYFADRNVPFDDREVAKSFFRKASDD